MDTRIRGPGGFFTMRPADYLVVVSLSFIVVLEMTTTETVLPAWINVVVSTAAAGVALLLWRDTGENKMGKEK